MRKQNYIAGDFHLMEVKQLCMLTNNTGLHEKISKEDILKNVGNQTVAGSHWLPQYENSWLPTFFKISSFLFNRKKKLLFHPIMKILSFIHRPPFPNLYYGCAIWRFFTVWTIKVSTICFWRTLFECVLKPYWLNVSFTCCSDVHFFWACTPNARVLKKPVKPHLITELRVIFSANIVKTHKVYV